MKAVAEITVLVNVAKNIEETCPKDVLAGKVWPVTLKGEVATTTLLVEAPLQEQSFPLQ